MSCTSGREPRPDPAAGSLASAQLSPGCNQTFSARDVKFMLWDPPLHPPLHPLHPLQPVYTALKPPRHPPYTPCSLTPLTPPLTLPLYTPLTPPYTPLQVHPPYTPLHLIPHYPFPYTPNTPLTPLYRPFHALNAGVCSSPPTSSLATPENTSVSWQHCNSMPMSDPKLASTFQPYILLDHNPSESA